jgi:hypothetical protein
MGWALFAAGLASGVVATVGLLAWYANRKARR